MKGVRAINLFTTVFTLSLLLFVSHQISGQTKCLSREETLKVISSINPPQNITKNDALRRELLKLQETRQTLEQKIIERWQDNQQLITQAEEMGQTHLLRLCEIIKQNGWVSPGLIGEDGMTAFSFLINFSHGVELQKEILPVVSEASKKGLIRKGVLAYLIDSIRVGLDTPQIFGTQTRINDEVFYLYPLQDESKVDDFRKIYGLPPLRDYIKYLQSEFGMPVIQSPKLPVSPAKKNQNKAALTSTGIPGLPPADDGKDEIIKVESNVVNLNVRVSANDSSPTDNFIPQKNDFAVFEDGKEQEISFFSSTETPFDLILVLDLSGSTADKQGLIRQSTKHFIEAARPGDRIAIITFTDEPRLVSDLTSDHEALLDDVKKISDSGGSGIWKAVEYAFEKIIKPESSDRRNAIILMTDGVDSSLMPRHLMDDSAPTFTHLLETIRKGSTTIIPIYLDTEDQSMDWFQKSYREARRTLSFMADESGGEVYYAAKVNDLNGVYEKVIKDLGKVYSIGYEPSESKHDNSWRSISVKIKDHPNLNVITKKGYYAK